MNDTIEVRPGEELDVARLEPYLREHLPEADGPFELRQFGGGHANLTYLVRFGEREYVLRRPPHGPLPAGGHDMQREFRVLSVLYRSFPLAPRAFALCTDPSVLGADFVVMERRDGIVIRRRLPADVAGDPTLQLRLGEAFVDMLAALHSVDYVAAGLSELGKAEGYLERQLSGWVKRWKAADSADRPTADDVIDWLVRTRPLASEAAIVHNDFKLDNTIVDVHDHTRFVAVLDWDMCTIGDPLADLGYVLALWAGPDDPPALRMSGMPTSGPGFPRRRDVIERYASKTKRDVSQIGWYHVFNIFRYAVIAQQIYVRFLRGQTQDERFREFGTYVGLLIDIGRELTVHPAV